MRRAGNMFEKVVVFWGLLTFIQILTLLPVSHAAEKTNFLTLEAAVKTAQQNDPWLAENRHAQDALESMSIAAGTYPDPMIAMGLINFPTDTFDINQEPMTQIKVGVSQMMPRGDSLTIKREQLKVTSKQYPYQRQDRNGKTAVQVSQLWLDAFNAQESIRLIEKDRPLFEQLADVAEASYSSALGKTRQQDIVRAQLELTRLDDRLTELKQKKEMQIEMLTVWLSDYFYEQYSLNSAENRTVNLSNVVMGPGLPETHALYPLEYASNQEIDFQTVYAQIADHPAIHAIDRKIKADTLGVDLANESYKPQWGINAGYGYRDDTPTGNDRADFFSIGLSFDLPFFTSDRQDQNVASAVSKVAAIKTQKWFLARKMIGDIEKVRTQLVRLDERKELYDKLLLPQMREMAEASLTAYTNDDGDFAEVVRSRIAELNAKITALNINVERQKAIIELNYYFMDSADATEANY